MSKVIARRYAQALFEVVEENQLERVADELLALSQALQDKDVARVLADPRTPLSVKEKLVLSIQPSPPVEALLRVMLSKRRLDILAETADAFRELTYQAQGKTVAEVISAVPLDPGTIEAIREKLVKASGKTVEVKTRLDEKLWGGFVVRIDGKIIDGSLAGSLKRFKQQMLS